MQIIIIGGGCSGVLVACNLLRHSKQKIDLTIIEPQAKLGQGVAYSTLCTAHLLNVVSQNMSAYSDDKDHLLNWLTSQHYTTDPYAFIPRSLYAQYLQYCLIEAQTACNNGSTVTILRDSANDLELLNSHWLVKTQLGHMLKADKVVLATGIFLKANSTNYLPNPWQYNLSTIPLDAKIGIIGSGLSMADMLLQFKQQAHRGSITVLARNGELPLAHDLDSLQHKLNIEWQIKPSLTAMCKQFRHNLKTALQNGYSWHNVLDSLRPFTQQIWRNWDDKNKKRFIRHLRSKWDTHRHRIAPEIAQQLAILQSSGFFKLIKATVINVEPGNIVTVHYKNNERQLKEQFDYVIDCAGLITDYTKTDSFLLNSLFRRNIIQTGPLNKGLAVSEQYELQPNLYALGFALHGKLWESIAVPELRVQAQDIAVNIFK